jgi:hypothetical protein
LAFGLFLGPVANLLIFERCMISAQNSKARYQAVCVGFSKHFDFLRRRQYPLIIRVISPSKTKREYMGKISADTFFSDLESSVLKMENIFYSERVSLVTSC